MALALAGFLAAISGFGRFVRQRVLRFWDMGFFRNYDGDSSAFAYIESKIWIHDDVPETFNLTSIARVWPHDLYMNLHLRMAIAFCRFVTMAVARCTCMPSLEYIAIPYCHLYRFFFRTKDIRPHVHTLWLRDLDACTCARACSRCTHWSCLCHMGGLMPS